MKTRIIQVGLGGWGQDWHRNILQPSTEIDLVGYVDMHAAALANAQTRLGLPEDSCFTTIGEAISAVDADAVLITANLGAHVPVALAALQAGKHVLVEKPFAATVAEARQVVELAEQHNRVLMVSQNYRFYPAVRAVAAIVREQKFGPVDAVSIDFRRYANGAPREGHRHYTLVHPLLMDMSIHHFDLMRFVLGQEPRQAVCHAWNSPWSNFEQPAEASATITFDGGAVVSYKGSWVSTGAPTPWAGEWRIECRDAEITMTSRADSGTGDDKVSIRPLKKAAKKLVLPELQFIDRAGTLHAFVQAIQEGKELECSGRDNLGTLGLMCATIESAETGLPKLIEL